MCRDEKENLSAKCKDEIFKTQLEGAQDYRTDADLHLACESDAKKICKDVKPGEGRVQDCLVGSLIYPPLQVLLIGSLVYESLLTTSSVSMPTLLALADIL